MAQQSSGDHKWGKILYVCVTDLPQSGSDRSFIATVINMHRRDNRVEAVLAKRGDMARKFEEHGITVNYVPMLMSKRYASLFYRLQYFTSCLWIIPMLMRVFKARGADIIHVNQTIELQPLLAAWLMPRVRLIVHNRGTVLRPKWFGRLITAGNMLMADHMIIVSDALAKVCHSPEELESGKITIIHGGQGLDLSVYDPERFPPDVVEVKRKEIMGDPGGFVVGQVSKFVDNRGHDLLVDVATKVREIAPDLDVRYVIVGGKSPGAEAYYDKVVRMIKERGLAEKFFLAGSQKSVSEFTSAFDLLVHMPVEWDSFPTVNIEAMALKKPVVAFRLGGIPEQVVEGRTGWLYDIGDTDGVASRIAELAANPEKARNAGIEGRKELLSNFSIERYLDRISEIYEKI